MGEENKDVLSLFTLDFVDSRELDHTGGDSKQAVDTRFQLRLGSRASLYRIFSYGA
jgi:hypothetical protein